MNKYGMNILRISTNVGAMNYLSQERGFLFIYQGFIIPVSVFVALIINQDYYVSYCIRACVDLVVLAYAHFCSCPPEYWGFFQPLFIPVLSG